MKPKPAEFFVKHRTAQETSGSGHISRPPPWEYDGPFATRLEAAAHWSQIEPHWQEGCVVTKCPCCQQWAPVDDA